MNLEDLIDESGLQQDEWSLTTPTFGKEGQLQVVGWSGKNKKGKGAKYYIVKCSKCSSDSELFNGGYFKSDKAGLIRGSTPCGCGKGVQWSKEQYTVLCQRKSKELGYKFLGFNGEWKGTYTKIRMLCESHGEWGSGVITHLLSKGVGCPSCMTEKSREINRKPDAIMIQSFLDSKAFHSDTEFWRSERKSSEGRKIFWYMFCPECGEVGESLSANLQRGHRPCACSKHRQQECYINLLVDGNNTAVAVKFGIANNSIRRAKQQNYKTPYEILQHSIYTFPSALSCKGAERECKQELECGVVLRRDMLDGYTETTWIYNLEKIIEIYIRNGGSLKQEA